MKFNWLITPNIWEHSAIQQYVTEVWQSDASIMARMGDFISVRHMETCRGATVAQPHRIHRIIVWSLCAESNHTGYPSPCQLRPRNAVNRKTVKQSGNLHSISITLSVEANDKCIQQTKIIEKHVKVGDQTTPDINDDEICFLCRALC